MLNRQRYGPIYSHVNLKCDLCFLRVYQMRWQKCNAVNSNKSCFTCSSPSVTQVFLNSPESVSNGLINKPLSFRLVLAFVLLSTCGFFERSLMSMILQPVATGRVLTPQTSSTHPRSPLNSTAPANLRCSDFSHSLSLPKTLTWRPHGAGFTEIAK